MTATPADPSRPGAADPFVIAERAQGVQAGNHNVQNNFFRAAARTPVRWPHRIGTVPLLATGRVDRPADSALESSVDTDEDSAAACRVVAGLGGVGKTQLAAALCQRWWAGRRVDLLMWVTASSRSSVLARYAQAAADVTGIEDADPRVGAERFLNWLAQTGHRWLIVLDDVADPADLRGLWPPATRRGRTVLTTRRRDSALLDGRTLIDVGVFTPAEALSYIQGKLPAPDQRDGAEDLAAALGQLPLALAQAVTYISDQDLTCTEYIGRLERRAVGALRPATLPDDQRTAVADTWSLSVELADASTGGLAGVLLQVAALMDPNGIPLDVFSTRSVLAYCSALLGRPVDADDVRDAIRALHRVGLVSAARDEPRTETAAVRIHALVQRVTRETTEPGRRGDMATAVGDALLELWSTVRHDRARQELLRTNTAGLHGAARRYLWSQATGGHRVLLEPGLSLGLGGQSAAATKYFRDLAGTATAEAGPDHRFTLRCRRNAAFFAYDENPRDVLADFEGLLADCLRILGPADPDTLETRGDIASRRGSAGEPGIVAEFDAVLADASRELGRHHRAVWTIRSNRAYWLGETGDPAGAVAAFEEILIDTLREQGADSPATLSRRFYIAFWRRRTGDRAGATEAMVALLADQTRALGPDSSETHYTRETLAYWRGEDGDPEGAAADLRVLLADRMRVLGAEHPTVGRTRESIAYWERRMVPATQDEEL
ncbi:NB-ARC domain-containing protein [Actinoplanes sp. GCM10030250]|uniref:NB-ARC domain-containing protein n=1 Tax=Actinoplanes sp. GCM10030250 TaxID=3273376 RepID=UPI00360CCC89